MWLIVCRLGIAGVFNIITCGRLSSRARCYMFQQFPRYLESALGNISKTSEWLICIGLYLWASMGLGNPWALIRISLISNCLDSVDFEIRFLGARYLTGWT